MNEWTQLLALWRSKDKQGTYTGTMRVDGVERKVVVKMEKDPQNGRPNLTISIPPEDGERQAKSDDGFTDDVPF